MEQKIKENLTKELSGRVEFDANGFVRIKSLNEIIDIVDIAVCRHYRSQLLNLANISKNFITSASKTFHNNNIEHFVLHEELQALEYAIKLAQEKFDE